MIIRDVDYNITSVHYSVHFKNRLMKRITISFFYYSCVKMLVIMKTYWYKGFPITEYYRIKEFDINET